MKSPDISIPAIATSNIARYLYRGFQSACYLSCITAYLLMSTGHASTKDVTPDFTLPTLTGGTVTLSAHKGEVVYVDFWATWCPPCRKSFPWMEQIYRKYKDAGLTIIAVSIDGKQESIEAFLRSNPVSFIIAHDKGGKTGDKFGLQGMPTSYLIGRDGSLHYTHAGFRESDKDILETRIKALLAQ